MSIQVLPIPALKDNYIWAIVNMQQHHCLIVDPGETEPVSQFLQQHRLSLAGILITHKHWDHCNGIAGLKENFSVPVFAPAGIAEATQLVKDNDKIQCQDFAFQVLHIPGHTLEHVAYYGHGMVFSGDTLFTAGCGRVFEGTFAQMYQSLQRLAQLPDDTLIYCGHEYTVANLRFAKAVMPHNIAVLQRLAAVEQRRAQHSPTVPASLAEEKDTNLFLRCEHPKVIQAVENHTGKKYHDPIQVFAELRQWKDHWTS